MLLSVLSGFPVDRKIINEGYKGDDNGNDKDDKGTGFKERKKEFKNSQTLKADGEEGGACGDDIGDCFYFSAKAGAHCDAFFQHQIADEKDGELAVDNQQKENRGKNTVNYKAEKTGDLHERIGKRIEKLAKVTDFVVFARCHTVEQVGNFGDDEYEPKYRYGPARSLDEP